MSLYKELNDQCLFELIKFEGDVVAFKEIYDRYYNVLFIHTYKRLRDREESMDVVQEIFTTLWDKKQAINLTSNLPGYLYKATRNKILNTISHKKVEFDYITSIQKFQHSGVCQTDHLVRENNLASLIEKEVNGLPFKMHQIFEMSRKQYLSHKEIAKELDLSEQTVKKQVNNALKILRTKITYCFFIIISIFVQS